MCVNIYIYMNMYTNADAFKYINGYVKCICIQVVDENVYLCSWINKYKDVYVNRHACKYV